MTHLRNALVTLAAIFLFVFAARAERGLDPREIYGRLLAPCCWTQTLDVHDSELSTQLRVEIAGRLTGGESALAIEDEMARRFGERIRAVPRARDPRHSMALVVFSALICTLGGLFFLAFRWTRRQRPLPSVHGADGVRTEATRTEYDTLLDRELARVDQ